MFEVQNRTMPTVTILKSKILGLAKREIEKEHVSFSFSSYYPVGRLGTVSYEEHFTSVIVERLSYDK